MQPKRVLRKSIEPGAWPREVLASFLLTLCGLLLSIGVYFFGLLTISDTRKVILFNEVSAAIDVQELKFLAERKVAQYRAYLITEDRKLLNEAARAHERYRVKSAALSARFKDPEALALLHKTDEVEERHSRDFLQLVKESQEKGEPLNRENFEARLRPLRDELDLAFAELLSHQRVQLEASQARGNAVDRTGISLAAIGAITSLLLFGTLAAIVWRSIFKLQQSQAQLSQSQEDAAAARRLFESVLEHIPVAVIIGEAPSGKLIFANNKMQEVWGHGLIASGAIEDYGAWKGFHADGRPYAPEDWPLARAILHGETVINEETRIERGDGSRGLLRLSAAPVRDSRGMTVAGVVICEDYTLRKRLEDERIELSGRERAAQESNRLKSIFLANMSHEIRTPINGVMGMAELLADTQLDAAQKEFVDGIQVSAGALLSVINDILDFSKVEAGKLELEATSFDFGSLLRHFERSFMPLMARKSLTFHIENRVPEPAFFSGDPARIRQILNNLVGNALKFTDEGSISLSVEVEGDSEGKASILCSVSDTGPGIAPATIERLFSPFMQADSSTSRRFGGSGLGLSICKRLVEMMGGAIGVESAFGEGARFWFRIFLERADPSTSLVTRSNQVIDVAEMSGYRILVAEDNPINRKIAELTLEKMGYAVGLAATGLEVLHLLERESFDLILMDCQMPDLDGYEATQKIREQIDRPYARIPIIAMTASSVRGDRELCLSVGMSDYISKPFKANELASILAKWLKKNPPVSLKKAAPAPREEGNRMDDEVLGSLLELGRSVSPEFLSDLLETFVKTAPAQIETMKSALKSGDLKALQFEAHRLKSATGNLGARRCSLLCLGLEQLEAWPEDLASVQVRLEELEAEYQHAVSILREKFAAVNQGKVA